VRWIVQKYWSSREQTGERALYGIDVGVTEGMKNEETEVSKTDLTRSGIWVTASQ
jgi:hypothetical protein